MGLRSTAQRPLLALHPCRAPGASQDRLLGSDVLCCMSSLGAEKSAPRAGEGRGPVPQISASGVPGRAPGGELGLGAALSRQERAEGCCQAWSWDRSPRAVLCECPQGTGITPRRAAPEARPRRGQSPVTVPVGGPLWGREAGNSSQCPERRVRPCRGLSVATVWLVGGSIGLCQPWTVCRGPSQMGSGRSSPSSERGPSLVLHLPLALIHLSLPVSVFPQEGGSPVIWLCSHLPSHTRVTVEPLKL